MSEKLKILLNERVAAIADSLLDGAIVTKDGYFWEGIQSVYIDDEETASITQQANIYAGAAGILLFLSEYYNYTGNENLRTPLKEGARGLITYLRQNKVESNSFIAGKLGVAYCLAKIGMYLEEPQLISEAVSICIDQQDYFSNYTDAFEFLDGLSGSIWVMVFLHSVTQREDLLPIIDAAVGNLLKHVKISTSGTYFDQIVNATRPLCGFSHGPSGVAHLFLELYRYFGNDSFARLASYCFDYEDQFFNYDYAEWPDFRRLEPYTFIEKKYTDKDWEYFTKCNYVTAWCHGGVGISLPRLYATDLGKKIDLKKVLLFLNKNLEIRIDANQTFTLCHGYCGLAETYLEAARISGNIDYQIHAENIYYASLQHFKNNNKYLSGYIYTTNEDYSLFMGTAGIGLSMLRYITNLEVGSITAPKVCGSNHSNLQSFTHLTLSFENVLAIILKSRYKSWFNLASHDLQYSFLKSLGKLNTPFEIFNETSPPSRLLNHEKEGSIQDALLLDDERFLLSNNMNYAINYARYILFKNTVASYKDLDITELIELNFVLNPESRTINLQSPIPNLSSDILSQKNHIILVPRVLNIDEIFLTSLEYYLYSRFTNSTSIRSVLETLDLSIFNELTSEIKNIHQWCLDRILDQIRGQLLLEHRFIILQ